MLDISSKLLKIGATFTSKIDYSYFLIDKHK